MPGRASDSELSVGELLSMIDCGQPMVLLDARNEEEFRSWRLDGLRPVQTVNLPYFEFIEAPERSIARLPDTGKLIAVVCAKGDSSDLVARMLREAGRNAKNVAGGMVAYGEHLWPVRVLLPQADAVHFELWQVNRRGKGCLSYILRAGGKAAVIDPSRCEAFYLQFVERLGAQIVLVLDTHVHADHVSGGRSLARSCGARYLLPSSGDAGADGAPLRLGAPEISIEALATPGHTPESVCYLIARRYLLSGDTLFARGVGRPDLGERVEDWARSLYRSLHRRLLRLPDATRVFPAHYSGLSEIGRDGLVSQLLGVLRSQAPELRLESEELFVQAMASRVAPPPPHYALVARINLGELAGSEDQIREWELGRNQCALRSVASAVQR
jgi:glyoxylase-like metal-dependent hydrolase (beta-lactamase superfamily II)/rhodanese-related sulfurtransferase